MDSEILKLWMLGALVVLAFLCFKTLVMIGKLLGCVCDYLSLQNEFMNNQAIKQVSDVQRMIRVRMWVSDN